MIGNISSIFHYLVIVVGYALNLWPVFVFFLIYTIFKRKPVTQLTIMVVIVVLIALQFEPTEYDDLSRIYDELDMFRRYGFLGFSNVYAASDRFEGRIVWFIFEWLCSYLPNFIYQVITSVLIYSFAGLLVLRIGKNEQFSEIETSRLIIFLFVLINLYSSISSSRYLVVMAILANLFYTEMVEKKHRISCWVGYVILCFCHTIALTLLLFRILAFFRKTILRVIFSILIIGWKQLIDQLEVIVSLLPADNPFFFGSVK